MEERQEKVPVVVYLLGFFVGAVSAFAVASEWLPQSSTPLATVAGGLGGVGGVELRESIFRVLVLALPAAVCIAIVIALEAVSRLVFIPNVGIPAILGGFAGMLVFNLWKALVR